MKTCFKCNVEKELKEFYKHSQMKDGHLNKCKKCTKKDVKVNYDKNIDYYRSYEKTEKRILSKRKRAKGYTKKYKEKNPKKRQAHIIVGNSIRSGALIRPNICSECERTQNIQAHHDDYNKPLEVRWLCSRCHIKWHKHNQAVC